MPLSDAERRLGEIIQRRDAALRADLAALVAIPTGRNHKAGLDEARGLLTSRLSRLGARVELVPGDPKEPWLYGSDDRSSIPPTAVCRRDGAGAARVLLSGHLDTVHDPAGPFQRLSVAADGRTALGPGCSDMKGGLLIAVAALEALEETGVRGPWGFILNSDEETGSYHSDAALRREAAAYDAGIALEPALPDGSLVVERPGSGQFFIEARGKAAHVGRDFASGVSAITALAGAVIHINAMADPARGRITNVGVIEGGAATNIVPDLARAWGNVRFATPDAASDLATGLDALVSPQRPGAAALAVHRSFNRPAKPLTPGVQRLADAARAAAQDLGQHLPFGRTGGVCDGNNLQAAGLPTIDTLGVRGGGLHTPEEWIDLSSLVERCQLLAVLVSRLWSGAA